MLLDFLLKIDGDYNPRLSSKVNLSEYASKIQKSAELIIDESDGVVRGLIVLYCNDEINKSAYIPLVGVLQNYRGQGIAKRCMMRAINIAKDKGMGNIKIHSNNPIAVKLYKDLGFHIIEEGERKLMMLTLK